MVVSDEQIWLFLGEVAKGYEPIMFQGGRFHLDGHASFSYSWFESQGTAPAPMPGFFAEGSRPK